MAWKDTKADDCWASWLCRKQNSHGPIGLLLYLFRQLYITQRWRNYRWPYTGFLHFMSRNCTPITHNEFQLSLYTFLATCTWSSINYPVWWTSAYPRAAVWPPHSLAQSPAESQVHNQIHIIYVNTLEHFQNFPIRMSAKSKQEVQSIKDDIIKSNVEKKFFRDHAGIDHGQWSGSNLWWKNWKFTLMSSWKSKLIPPWCYGKEI